jgi:3-ketosteroid 9alpha-monooxygenase subunit B
LSRLTFHPLRVAEVIDETADARSIVFDVPEALRDTFRFRPGQHLTLRVPCGTKPALRCYSCSSIPGGEALRVTAKRMTNGVASGWLCGSLKAGDTLEVAPPAGVFTPRALDGEFLMFAGGSGITPVFSILRSVLAKGTGRVRLVYANRDEKSVIFGVELARLSRENPGRLQVIHWLDSVQGIPSQAQLAALGAGWEKAQCFICGPASYMDTASAALHALGIANHSIHVERFVSLPDDADAAAAPQPTVLAGATPVRIEVELDGAHHVVEGQPGQLLIESLEAAGLAPPFSCRAGACAACMCRLEDGAVELEHNHVLSEAELNDGWILACQAIPQSPTVKIRYSP